MDAPASLIAERRHDFFEPAPWTGNSGHPFGDKLWTGAGDDVVEIYEDVVNSVVVGCVESEAEDAPTLCLIQQVLC